MKTIIISEVGVNHDGSFTKLKNIILKSKIAGADYVKLQIYNTDELVIKKTSSAKYQKRIEKNQYNLLKKYELSKKNIIKISDYCEEKKIKLIATCFDIESFNFCKKVLSSSIYKIGSGDLDNLPLIYEIAQSRKKIILSTGMSSIYAIDLALKTIIHAYNKNKKPSLKKIKSIRLNKKNLTFLKNKVSVLHCVSAYPTKISDLNLNFIQKLKKKYNLEIGFSDHTQSIFASSIAVALGARIIEKHFTLNNNLKGPDHTSSLNFKNFTKFVKNIRETENMLGLSIKRINNEEKQNSKIVKKSIYAKKNISIGETFSLENLSVKRPKKGKDPSFLWSLLGKKSKKNYKTDQLI